LFSHKSAAFYTEKLIAHLQLDFLIPKGLGTITLTLLLKTCNGWALNTFLFKNFSVKSGLVLHAL